MADEYEQIINQIGNFGPFQRLIFILINLGDLQTAWSMLLPVFINAKPHWTCIEQPVQYNVTNTVNITQKTNVSDNSCSTDCNIVYAPDFTSIQSEWSLICDHKFIGTLTTTLQMLGVLFGALILSQLSDLFGRKKVWYGAIAVNAVFSIATAFSTSWQMFSVFRFIVGFCLGGLLNINYLYPMEFIGPKWRPLCGNIGLWQIGVASLSLFAYFIRDWRILTLATSIPPLFMLLTWWVIPESPRWLAMRKRYKESEEILTQMALRNNRSIPEFRNMRNFVEEEDRKRGMSKKFTYFDLFRTPKMTMYTLILMYAWFVCSAVFYGLSLNIKNLAGDRYINNMIGGLVDIPAVLLVIYTANAPWCGRKRTLFSGMLLAGITLIGVLFLKLAEKSLTEVAFGQATVALAMTGKFGIAVSWSASYLIAAEIFPTLMRSIGSGACSIAARIGGIVAPQFVFLHEIWSPFPFIVFGSIAIISALTVIVLPETRGKPMPDAIPEWSWTSCKDSKDSKHSELPMSDIHNNKVDIDVLDDNHLEQSSTEILLKGQTKEFFAV